MKKIISSILIYMFIMIAMASTQPVQAEQGFGASGPFAGYHYKLIQGESIEIPQIYVVFFNNYNTEINVQLSSTVPEGVTIDLDSDLITMPANSNMEVPVRISTSESAAAGDYIIGVAAEVIPDEINGIQIIGSAQLSAQLSIYGEAGRYSVTTETAKGDPFEGELTIYRREDNDTLAPVGYSDDGTFSDRVIPGTYVAQMYYNGSKVVDYEFVIENGDDLEIVLIAQTVFIRTFLVGPVFNEETDLLQSTQIVYTIENIYEEIENARLMLIVLLDGEEVDNLEIMFTGVLMPGEFEGRYTYIPTRGWRAGDYSFQIIVYEDDFEHDGTFMHDDTEPQVYEISREIVEPYWALADYLLYGGIALLVIALIVLFILKRDKDYTFIEKVDRNKKAKRYYYELRTMMLRIDKVSHNLSETGDWYIQGKKKFAKFTMMKKALQIHMRTAIENYPITEFNQKDFSHIKELRVVPFTMDLTTDQSLELVKQVLMDILSELTGKSHDDLDQEILEASTSNKKVIEDFEDEPEIEEEVMVEDTVEEEPETEEETKEESENKK